MSRSKTSVPSTLPLTGYSRLSQLLPFLPIGKTTIYQWSKDGRFPAPVKISGSVTAWSNEAVHAWLDAQANNAA